MADSPDFVPDEQFTPDPMAGSDDPMAEQAANGLRGLIATAPVQKALDFGNNLDQYHQMVQAAMGGDPNAKLALAQHSMGTAMGTLGPVEGAPIGEPAPNYFQAQEQGAKALQNVAATAKDAAVTTSKLNAARDAALRFQAQLKARRGFAEGGEVAPSPDFVPDHEFKPDAAPQASSDFIPDEQFTPDDEKYGSLGQQALAGAEGAAQGFAGPLATGAELGLSKLGVPGLSAEDQAGRKAANPWTHGIAEAGAMGAGLLTGTGEAGLIAKAAEAVPGIAAIGELGNVGKVGAATLKGAIEGGLFQSSDEISNAMLGQGDPEAPVSSALAHIGAAGLLTGGIGGALGLGGVGLRAIADSKIGAKASQLVEDFGNRWKYHQDNPNLVDSIKNELTDFHGSTAAGADEVYGSTGLKAQAIRELVPEMNEAIQTQSQGISQKLEDKIAEMVKDPESYPARLTKKLMGDSNKWMEVATNPESSSEQVFNATQDLKQKLQAYSKFDKQVGPLSAEQDFIATTKELQHGLVRNLEDTSVWGKAGALQKEVNGAFKDFLPAHKDFLSKFTEKVEGEPVISPGKINTYVNQLGKPSAEIKQGMLKNYIDAAEQYRSKINDLHSKLGLESPLGASSLNAVKGTLGEDLSQGAKWADQLFHNGVAAGSTKIAGGILGASEGYHREGVKGAVAGAVLGYAAPHLEKVVARQLKGYAIPAVLRALGQGEHGGIGQIVEHANAVQSGAQKITKGIKGLFEPGAQQVYNENISDAQRNKLKKFIENGTLNQQMQQAANAPSPKPSAVPQFAQGGQVDPMANSALIPTSHDPIAATFPEQSMLMSAAKGRVNNYLNQVRPQAPIGQLPFDKKLPNKQADRSYNKAIDIALQPLSILNQIKKGSLTPDSMTHFTTMYPELYGHLSKKINEQMISDSVKKATPPPYKVRQAMGLFLNSPVDSAAKPANIQAAQSVFAAQAQQNQGPQKGVSDSKMKGLQKLPQSYQTPEQSRQQRQNKS